MEESSLEEAEEETKSDENSPVRCETETNLGTRTFKHDEENYKAWFMKRTITTTQAIQRSPRRICARYT
ncbi:hypothetical protein QSH57_005052, partial [Fusarium oxysporum f. sp. vasinfectum]